MNYLEILDDVVFIYGIFKDNSEKLGLSKDDVVSLTSTVAKAIVASRADRDSSNHAIAYLGDALNSGFLGRDELNGIMEHAHLILRAIAEGLDFTVGEIRMMTSRGCLTSNIIVRALKKSSKFVDEAFNKEVVNFAEENCPHKIGDFINADKYLHGDSLMQITHFSLEYDSVMEEYYSVAHGHLLLDGEGWKKASSYFKIGRVE